MAVPLSGTLGTRTLTVDCNFTLTGEGVFWSAYISPGGSLSRSGRILGQAQTGPVSLAVDGFNQTYGWFSGGNILAEQGYHAIGSITTLSNVPANPPITQNQTISVSGTIKRRMKYKESYAYSPSLGSFGCSETLALDAFGVAEQFYQEIWVEGILIDRIGDSGTPTATDTSHYLQQQTLTPVNADASVDYTRFLNYGATKWLIPTVQAEANVPIFWGGGFGYDNPPSVLVPTVTLTAGEVAWGRAKANIPAQGRAVWNGIWFLCGSRGSTDRECFLLCSLVATDCECRRRTLHWRKQCKRRPDRQYLLFHCHQ
jgi:hypothetical protein